MSGLSTDVTVANRGGETRPHSASATPHVTKTAL